MYWSDTSEAQLVKANKQSGTVPLRDICLDIKANLERISTTCFRLLKNYSKEDVGLIPIDQQKHEKSSESCDRFWRDV